MPGVHEVVSKRTQTLKTLKCHRMLCEVYVLMELIGGLDHEFYDFPYSILGMSSSQLTFIFFRGVGIPPTR